MERGLGVAAELGDQVSCGTCADAEAFAELFGGDRAVVQVPVENVFGACAVEQVLLPCA